ncbi:MAG: GNAT family N-acetyltransferase [Pyrinomonadaceae bacterium]|nr:GNAT family N-acetyltransferase [Pyrinomonadaceae bacterium]
MKSDLLIRKALTGDSEEVAKLLSEAFGPFEDLYTPEAFEATILDGEKIRERITEDGVIWVALENEKIIGTVSVVDEVEGLYIRSMAVSLKVQKRGIGQKLIEKVERYAVAKKFEKLYLYTTPFLHGAIRLYERNGFKRRENIDGFFGTALFAMDKKLN